MLIAFSDGDDDDSNGFVDDIVGWDFLDNDNDPFDDVQYGHGTGEARDSSGEADNGGDIGSLPELHGDPHARRRLLHRRLEPLRAGRRSTPPTTASTSIQEALGTLNNSSLSRAAVEYAYDHGVTVIASAADEAAQHHNWPSSLPHVIIVNSIEKYDLAITPATHSYLQFNGCTNFSSKITVAIPSVSCSSDATGPRVRHGGPDLQRGAERARAGRARPPPHLPAHRRQRLRDHAERGAPDHGVGPDRRRRRRPTT